MNVSSKVVGAAAVSLIPIRLWYICAIALVFSVIVQSRKRQCVMHDQPMGPMGIVESPWNPQRTRETRAKVVGRHQFQRSTLASRVSCIILSIVVRHIPAPCGVRVFGCRYRFSRWFSDRRDCASGEGAGEGAIEWWVGGSILASSSSASAEETLPTDSE